MSERNQVFISYSHKDAEWLRRLQTMLKPLLRQNAISIWDDTLIQPGVKWRFEIEQALAKANVAVLLVSADFLGSDFIAEHELPPLLQAAEQEGLAILWVYLGACLYDETPIKDYKAAHNISIPLEAFPTYEQNAELRLICKAIKKVCRAGAIDPKPHKGVNAADLIPTVGNIELNQKTPAEFADLILQRLDINEGNSKDHYVKVDADQAAKIMHNANLIDIQHKKLATNLLNAVPLFFQYLQEDFKNEQPTLHCPTFVNEMIDYFATCLPEQVPDLFFMVRRALEAANKANLVITERTKTCSAASALYCLAAIRLVDKTAKAQGSHILQVPRSESVICAIIATALFGGQLHLPLLETNLPRPEYVFEIPVAAAGDHLQLSFERALYTALFDNNQQACLDALEVQPLTDDESKKLAARLRSIKNVKRECFALIVHGYVNQDSAKPFSEKHQIPVMFPASKAANILLGMEAGELLQEISEFWQELSQFHQPNNTSSITAGNENMTNSGINIHAPGGTVVLSTGANSAAQAGNHNSAHTGQQQMADLSALNAQLLKLQAAIAALSSEKAKENFSDHLQTAQDELKEKDQPDVGIVKQSLEAIKQGGEVIEGGEKIVELCTKALPLLAVLTSIF